MYPHWILTHYPNGIQNERGNATHRVLFQDSKIYPFSEIVTFFEFENFLLLVKRKFRSSKVISHKKNIDDLKIEKNYSKSQDRSVIQITNTSFTVLCVSISSVIVR